MYFRGYNRYYEDEYNSDEVVKKIAELVRNRRYGKVPYIVKTMEDDDY